MHQLLARLLSSVGHPIMMMVVAVVLASPRGSLALSVTLGLACGLGVLAYSYHKARRGDWAHIDASNVSERAELSIRTGIGLLAVAGALALTDIQIAAPIVVALSGCMILTGYLTRRLAKMSLHVGFSVFAALIVWPQLALTASLLVVALAVGWSRLILQRHVVRDLILGAVVGGFAGLILQVLRSATQA